MDANVLLSPASLALPLAMLANGAKTDTLTELTTLLGAKSLDELNPRLASAQQALATRTQKVAGRRSGEVRLDIASSLWMKQGWTVKEGFLKATSKWYGAGVHGVDFSDGEGAAAAINGWVAQHTNERIKNLVQPDLFDQQTRMVLANTVWFKSPWMDEFGSPSPATFHLADGRSVQARMMKGEADSYAVDENCQAAAKRYIDGKLAMLLVLPRPGREAALLDDWAEGGLAKLVSELTSTDVELTMPTWKFEQTHDLAKMLDQMGVKHLFRGQRVDLSGVSDEPTAVTSIVQRTWIEVDEKGTEAAAATAVVVGAAAPGVSDKVELVLDRPFWYLIVDLPTGTPLFIGRVGDPTQP